MAKAIPTAEYERGRTWLPEITQACLPASTRWRDEGPYRRYLQQGGLIIHLKQGWWYSHSAKIGGYSPIAIIKFLKSCRTREAVEYFLAFLSSHPGTGSCGTEIADDDAGPASQAAAQYIRDNLIPDVLGTDTEIYLRSRGLPPPYPPCVAHLRNARPGESAFIVALEWNGRITGYQLLYLDAYGVKSLVRPVRRRFNLEAAPGAIFPIVAGTGDGVLIGAGAEDALSLAKLGRAERVIGLPGDGALQHLKFAQGTRAIFVRDGDKPDCPADRAVVAGLDALLIQKIDVDVTPTPDSEDANSIWQSGPIAALSELVDSAHPAELSKPWGIVKYAATLDRAQLETERKKLAKKIGWRVSIFSEEVERLRDARRFHSDDAGTDNDDAGGDGDLAAPVELDKVLDDIVAELRRYIVASDHVYTTIALWAAHTHIVHHVTIKLTVSPRLAIQANDASCGKTITLECVGCLVPRPRLAASVTASSVLRSIGITKPTYLIDEADQLLKHLDRSSELLAVLNASHRRKTAFVERSVPTSDGGWVVEYFSVWCAMALASIGPLPRTQQERSVVVHLDKALIEDIKEHLEDGESAELVKLRKLLTAWGGDLGDLPRPTLPSVLMKQAGRVGDNWRPLLAIAAVAGERWRNLAEAAVLASIGAERQLSLVQRLLLSIRVAFTPPVTYDHNDEAIPQDPIERIETRELVQKLISDRSEEWDAANHGKAITQYWLRDQLRGLLDPPGAEEWQEGKGPARRHCHGYYKAQFEKAWRSHLADIISDIPSPHPASSGTSGISGEPADNRGKFDKVVGTASGTNGTAEAEPPEPDVPDAEPDACDKNYAKSKASPDIPNVPDGGRGDEHIQPNGQDGPVDPQPKIAPNRVEEQIISTWQEHKDWSAAKIASACGVTPRRVKTVIAKFRNSGEAGAAA